MGITEHQDTLSEIDRVKHEIDKLNQLQTAALKLAVYGGMTPDEANEYDERRGKLTRLVQQLAKFTKAL